MITIRKTTSLYVYGLLLFSICTLSFCSIKKENTFEENFALCKRRQILDEDTIKYPRLYGDYECMKGSAGPVFTALTNRGKRISTAPTNGKPIILYFWLTSKFDPPEFARSTAEDIESMNVLYHRFSSEVDFIGFPFNDTVTVRQYLKIHPLDFPQVIDTTVISKENYITQNSYPLILFINSKGKIFDIHTGSLKRKDIIIKEYTSIIQNCISSSKNNQ